MKSLLHISDSLDLPLDCVTQKLAILGTSGSGKSYTAMKLAELMLDAGAQIIGVDPVGIWYSLRLSANGKKVGYKQVVVFGGDHGDMPLAANAGTVIGRFLAERKISAVLDVSQFITAEIKHFLTDFAESFFQAKKKFKSPVHLFLEECQTYIPQDTSDRQDPTMLNRWERLIKFFRNYGGGISMISQQPQSVNKKVLNLADTMFAMRTIGHHERAAILKWVKDVIESEENLVQALPKLPTGVAHIWSPLWLGISRDVKILPRKTFDASRTPEVGEQAIEPQALSPIDVEALTKEIGAIIEQAKADDPKELRKQIAELQKQVAAKTSTKETIVESIDRAELQRIAIAEVQRILQDKIQPYLKGFFGSQNERIAKVQRDFSDAVIHLATIDSYCGGELSQPALAELPKALALVTPKPSGVSKPLPVLLKPLKQAATASSNGFTASVDLPKGEKAVLVALAQYPEGAEGNQICVLTGYKARSRDAYLQRLREKGFAERRGDSHLATQEGINALGNAFEALPTGTDLQQYWRERLPEGERKILELLLPYPLGAVSKESLEKETGYARRSVDAYLQRLTARKLVESVGRGEVRASESLF